MKKIILLLLFCSYKLFASIQVSKLPLSNLGTLKPQVAGKTLVYTDPDTYLWANHGNGSESIELEYEGNRVRAYQLFAFKENVYFTSPTKEIYKTNGETVNLVSSTKVSQLLNESSGHLIGKVHNSNDFLLISDSKTHYFDMGEQSIFTGSGRIKDESSLCILNSQQAVFKNSTDRKLYFYDNGDIAKVSDIENTEFQTRFENDCYYLFIDNSNNSSILRVNDQAEVNVVDAGTTNRAGLIFNFDNRLYVLKDSVSNTWTVNELIADSNESKPVHSINEQNLYPYSIKTSANHLYLFSANPCDSIFFTPQKCTPIPPGPTQLITLDRNFEIIDRHVGSYGHPYNATILSDQDLLMIRSYFNYIYEIKEGQISAPYYDPKLEDLSIIGGAEGLYYLNSIDFGSMQRNIFVLHTKPIVNHYLSGLWYDLSFSNQGISVQTGTRADGSDYLFTSLYTYKNGQPFWAAGIADFSYSQDSVRVDLYEYEGSSYYIDQDSSFSSRTHIGEIEFIPTGCNQLQANVSISGETDSATLDLQRITDNTINNLCIE